jgi:zinc protease
MRGIALLALTTLLAAPGYAAEVHEFTLANGLQGVVIEDHRAPVVVNMVWYRIGAADEVAGTSGVAHFLEHLMFQGTENLAPGELTATVDATGGSDNAFTSYDYTAYFQRVAADELDRMMEMEADRMVGLKLTEEDVATERDVIIQERAQRTDSEPSALLGEQMDAALYLNHPYGRPVIGWKHEMEGLTREDAIAFYKANYAPNNAILVVAGDVTPEEVRALAEKHFGGLAPSDAIVPRDRPSEPPQLAARRIAMVDARVSEPYVSRAYLAPERNSGDQRQAAALVLLSQLLGGNPTTSVFAKALQFDRQIAVYAGAGYSGTSIDATSLQLTVVPLPNISLKEAEAALDEVLVRFLVEGVDAEELTRIKAQVGASEIYGDDSTQGLAQKYGAALTVGLDVADVQAWPGILQDISEEEIMAVARKVLVPENSVTGWLSAEEVAR